MSIEDVQRKYENRLLGLPNVNGVGIGRRDGKEVIKVFVTRKVPETSLQPGEVIPKALDGFETDVQELGEVTAQAD